MDHVTVPGALLKEILNNVNIFWLSQGDGAMALGVAEKTAEWYVWWGLKCAVSISSKAPHKSPGCLS
jgi:hypothetical protein